MNSPSLPDRTEPTVVSPMSRCPTCGLNNPGPEHRAYEPMLCPDRPQKPRGLDEDQA